MKEICPSCEGRVAQVNVEKQTQVKGVDVTYTARLHQCCDCGLELADTEETATMQERLADAYRHAVGLLSSEEIRQLRQKQGFSQQALAEALEVGVASIKRWETGVVQSKSMDNLLRTLLQDHPCNEHTGNRDFSIPRIRLVLDAFESQLGRPLLKKDDRMLYAAKYLWYADMSACRDLGRSMTGSTYAALPMGPQLNNYRDLVDEIFKADLTDVPPLSQTEAAIIALVAKTFPTNKQVFDASHREALWQGCPTGALIPYSRAAELIEMPHLKDLP
ncbi:MAG: type II toxin-antitoxin system MqsA family antitoxin [Desulfuromonadaceae bacterium]|nr:type II toxin-antitoxin system MqsA family antitoxin [Desulfuromonadaceae bacterium]